MKKATTTKKRKINFIINYFFFLSVTIILLPLFNQEANLPYSEFKKLSKYEEYSTQEKKSDKQLIDTILSIPMLSKEINSDNIKKTNPKSKNSKQHSNILLDTIHKESLDTSLLRQSHSFSEIVLDSLNSKSFITFRLSKKSFVKFNLYDSQGTYIKSFIHHNLAAGNYKYILSSIDSLQSYNENQFTLQPYPKGTYFYEIKANDFTEIIKINLVK
ncbi:MAG: hypothetical protein J0M18_05075 [Ignavibacteria bacterium]|nr:hypothetical protein [Ignavibacteria bacterium]